MTRRLLILIAAAVLGAAASTSLNAEDDMSNHQTHPYLGMWVTGDGHIRRELLPDGRYDEARATAKVPIGAGTK